MPYDVLSADDLVDDEKESHRLHHGARLGRYELVLPVARGGMARVWAARLHGNRGFSKQVAIKTILGELAANPRFERMFLDEAQIAAAIHHPNVCEIYELGEHEGVLYIAMEWVTGDSLARVLHKRGRTSAPIDAAAAVRIVADACAGLHAAHELRDETGELLHVVHRDISPHNILLTADGIAKLADFGIAKALKGFCNDFTGTGQLKGKISYMSPEYVSGEAIDRRTDIFSMGVVLYEATTGVLPFQGENEAQTLHALMEHRVVPPTHLSPTYSRELEAIVLRAISHEAGDRYETAEAFRFALENWLARHAGAGTHKLVSEVMRERVGGDIDDRRERVRQSVRRLPTNTASGPYPIAPVHSSSFPAASSSSPPASTASEPPPVDSLGGLAVLRSREKSAPARAASRFPMHVAAGVAVAALLGGLGGLAMYRASQPNAAAAAVTAPPQAAAPLPPPTAATLQSASTGTTATTTPDQLPSIVTPVTPVTPVTSPAPSSRSTPPAFVSASKPTLTPASAPAPAPAPAPRATSHRDDDTIPDNPYAPRGR